MASRALLPPVQVAGVRRRPAGRAKEEQEKTPRPAARRKEEEKKKEREKERGNTGTPNEKRTRRKTPRRSQTKTKPKHYTPTRTPSLENRTNILPKSSPQNSVHLRPLEKENSKIAKLSKRELFAAGFFRRKL